jgi:hypothetical protein
VKFPLVSNVFLFPNENLDGMGQSDTPIAIRGASHERTGPRRLGDASYNWREIAISYVILTERCRYRPKIEIHIPKPIWMCPHCGRAHTPADLVRLDSDHFLCKGCGKPFLSNPANKAE